MTTPKDCVPSPPTLSAAGTSERLQKLLARPVVAIAGARHSTYYGQETRQDSPASLHMQA